MAKNKAKGTQHQENNMNEENVTGGENVSEGTVAGAAPTPTTVAEPKTDERYKFVQDPETKQPIKRKEYILKLWAAGKSRGEIAKHLTEISGKKVPYQIVFAATRGVAGGPPKAPETPAEPAAS